MTDTPDMPPAPEALPTVEPVAPPESVPPPAETEPEPQVASMRDESLAALASALTETLNLLLSARRAVLDAFTPTSGAKLTSLASDHLGLADSVAFVAPHLTLAGPAQNKAQIATESLDALQQYLGSQYKVATLSPTALAEQLSTEPRLMAHLRSLAPTLDVLRSHPFLSKVLDEAETSGSSTVTVHADSLRDFLTGS